MSLDDIINTLDFDWTLCRIGRVYFARDSAGLGGRGHDNAHAALIELRDKIRARRQHLRDKNHDTSIRSIRVAPRRMAAKRIFSRPLGYHR